MIQVQWLGAIRAHTDRLGAIRAHNDRLGAIRAHTDRLGAIRARADRFGAVRALVVLVALAAAGCVSDDKQSLRERMDALEVDVRDTRKLVLERQAELDGQLTALATELAGFEHALAGGMTDRDAFQSLVARVHELEAVRRRQQEIIERLIELEKRIGAAALEDNPSSLADWYRRRATTIDAGHVQALVRNNSTAP